MSHAARRWRYGVPLGVRRRVGGTLRALVLHRMMARRRRTRPAPGPVVALGFVEEGFGIGRAGRYTIDGLRAAGAEVTVRDLRPLIEGRGQRTLGPLPPGGVLVVHANPPEAIAALSRLPSQEWRSRYLVGYWAYELERAPASWRRAARVFDEVWVPSQFVADALTGARVRVHVRPHPVPLSPPAPLVPHRFVVAVAGDLASSTSRKNLSGNVEAYLAAFPEPEPGVSLIVKTRPAPGHEGALSALRALVSTRADVRLVAETLTDAATDALFGEASVFLSAHRAEGYGLVLAERLARGVPVIATGWSGNLAFMDGATDLLLPYALVPVRDEAGLYPDALRWAEPNIDAAAAALRWLRADPGAGRAAAMRVRDVLGQQHATWIEQARPLIQACQAEAAS